jgi:protein-S-isoprenylcysteine O-methyltransferase Ste14
MPLFEDSTARPIFYVVVVIWILIELRQSMKARAGATFADANSREMLRVSTIAGIVVAVICEHNLRSLAIRPTALSVWGGLIVMALGIALRFWSFQALGQYFTFTVQASADQHVISTVRTDCSVIQVTRASCSSSLVGGSFTITGPRSLRSPRP